MSSNNSCSFFILFSSILLVNLNYAYLTTASSCLRQCGEVDIPYPFGIGKGCYLEKWYEIECANSSITGMLEPFLSVIRKQVVKISLPLQAKSVFNPITYGTILIKNPMTSNACSTDEQKHDSLLNFTGMPFYVSFRNSLIATGCNNKASLTNVEPNMVGCMSTCGAKNRTALDVYFTRMDCNDNAITEERSRQLCDAEMSATICMANMPAGFQRVVGVKIEDNNTTTEGCKVAFLTSESYNMLDGYSPQQIHALRYSNVELRWFIHTTNLSFIDSLGCRNIPAYNGKRLYDPTTRCVCAKGDLSYGRCGCNIGYEGNPYVECKGQ